MMTQTKKLMSAIDIKKSLINSKNELEAVLVNSIVQAGHVQGSAVSSIYPAYNITKEL